MIGSIIILIILSLFLGAGAWLVFLWAVKKGEFDDAEGPKYRMLQDDDEEPIGNVPEKAGPREDAKKTK